jgi:hypothetical protein
MKYCLTGVLIEAGQFHSWLIKVNSIVGRFAFKFLIAVAVVYDNSTHLRIFLWPFFALSLVRILGILIGGVFRRIAIG